MLEVTGQVPARSTSREAFWVAVYVAALVIFSAAWKSMAPPASIADAASKRPAVQEISAKIP